MTGQVRNAPGSPADEEWLKEPELRSLGLKQVYPDPKSRAGNATLDVVFVHGLGGDSSTTWTKDKVFWIRDLLPQSPYFENARIMTFGYDARAFLQPFARSTRGRTFTFAEELLSDLKDKRASPAARRRPVLFLGHSLGGIVIKAALRHAHALPTLYGDILASTKAIVFFGTPHQGSDVAVWTALLGGLGKAIRLRSTEVLRELERWSNPLLELTTTFSELAGRFDIATFFETRAINGVLVVHEGSARMGLPNEQARALEADHRGVCKFTEADNNWRIVSGRLDAIAERMEQGLELGLPPVPQADLQQDSEEDLVRRLQALRQRT